MTKHTSQVPESPRHTPLPIAPFPYPLQANEAPTTGSIVIGFVREDMWIFDPTQSECGRFPESPPYYGLTDKNVLHLKRLNELLENATYAATDAGALAIQEAFGITDGGFAGIFFSDPEHSKRIALSLAEYLMAQHAMGLIDNDAS